MKLSTQISKYIAKSFLISIGISLLTLLAVIFIGDIVEFGRRLETHQNAGWGTAIKLAILHLPYMVQEIIPYAVLFGSMLCINKLSNTQELIIIRSTGLSLWQIFLPGTLISIFIGIFIISIFNPLISATQTKLQKIEAENFGASLSSLSVSGSGFWLRQAINNGTDVIYARNLEAKEMRLKNVTVFRFDKENNITMRLDSDTAELKDGFWYLLDANITDNSGVSSKQNFINLPTSLTKSQIQEGFSSPETMSIWTLIPFIKMLQKAGFSAKNHRLHLHMLVSLPILLAGMTLLGCSINIRKPKGTRGGLRFLLGISLGFALFYLMTIIEALGLSSKVNIAVAAWLPSIIPFLLGISLLIHMEET